MASWKVLTVAGIATATLAGVSVMAFKPNETSHGHRMMTEGVLFSGYSYGGLSVPVFSTTLSDGKTARFSSLAATHVMLGNKSTDLPTADFKLDGVEIDLLWELTNPVAHCDDEKIANCSERIRGLRETIVSLLKSHVASGSKLNLGHARGNLGKALHTLQDFYAHSNHADVHSGAQIFAALTGNVKAVEGAYAHKSDVSVCEARAPTLAWVLTPTYANNGGNWKLVGKGLSADEGNYTTGFFTFSSVLGNQTASDTGGVKCDHGNEGGALGTGFSVISGISKDVPYAPLDDLPLADKQARGMPSAIHVRASHQAALHTHDFVTSVIAAIKTSDPDVQVQDKMIKALLGIDDNAAFGFVLDRTGSMGDIIEGVKAQIQKLIDDAVAAGGDAATRKFMIVDYGDPDVSTPVIGTAAEIKTYLGTVFARGGGDCPERTNSGLRAALALTPRGSSLYVFTDASSNDAGLAAEVLATAQSKNVTVSYAVSGSCSPIDPTYHQVAAGTGGQVIEVEHTTAGVAAAFTSISIDAASSTSQPVVIEAGTLSGAKTINLPVEVGATRLSVVVNSDSGTIEFLSPTGAVVPSPSVLVNEFLGGSGLKVTNPQPGTWGVRLAPSAPGGTYSVRADVASTTNLESIRFYSVEPGGRTGHEGPVEFRDGPPAGKSRVEVVVRGAAAGSSPTLDILSPGGDLLSSVPLAPQQLDAYIADVDLTQASFRLKVSGPAAGGQSYARVAPALYAPRPFTMEIVDESQWAQGIEGELRVKLTNHAADQSFSIAAQAPSAGAVTAVQPQSVVLARGASAVVSVKLAVAPSAELRTRHVLTVSASDANGVQDAFRRYLTFAEDSDGDGVPDAKERGTAGNDPTYDGNGDGVPDWTQPNVASLYSRQQKGYVTLSVPAPATLSLATSLSPPDGAPGAMPLDMFSFRIVGVAAGSPVAMRMILPTGITAGGFAKYGPEPGQVAPHWYTFASTSSTGATVNGNVITLQFVDGARGDDDLLANGVISDAGGPMEVAAMGIAPAQDPPVVEEPRDSGGSGGCTVGNPSKRDPTLIVLTLFAGMTLWVRRRRKSR